jgi:hypothetical protein
VESSRPTDDQVEHANILPGLSEHFPGPRHRLAEKLVGLLWTIAEDALQSVAWKSLLHREVEEVRSVNRDPLEISVLATRCGDEATG